MVGKRCFSQQKGSKNHTVEWKLVELDLPRALALSRHNPWQMVKKRSRATSMVTRATSQVCGLRYDYLSSLLCQADAWATRGPWFIVGTVRSVRVCKFGIFALMFKHVWARKVSDTTYIYIYIYLFIYTLTLRTCKKKAACDFKARVCNENLGF